MIYLSNFADYGVIYGSLGTAIALLVYHKPLNNPASDRSGIALSFDEHAAATSFLSVMLFLDVIVVVLVGCPGSVDPEPYQYSWWSRACSLARSMPSWGGTSSLL